MKAKPKDQMDLLWNSMHALQTSVITLSKEVKAIKVLLKSLHLQEETVTKTFKEFPEPKPTQ